MTSSSSESRQSSVCLSIASGQSIIMIRRPVNMINYNI